MAHSRWLFASLWILMAGLLSSCDQAKPPAPPKMEPAVKIAQPLAQQVTEWDEYTGRIEAVNSVEIRARVSGYLEKMLFTAGAKVNKGDLLFVIDPKPYQAQLNFAQAELERAKTRQELAKNDLTRAENLLQGKAISAEEYDARNKGLRESAAAVHSAEANVYTAKLNLQYTEIHAPVSGRISREMLTIGNLVNADSSVLANLVSIDPVYVYVDADEQSLLKYRRQAQKSNLIGTPLQLALADETEFAHQGKLDYVAPRENAGTGTVTLRGVFANPNELLSPGFFARVRVQGGEPHAALLVPDRAIGSDQAQRFVWLVKPDNQLDYRPVKIGSRVGELRVIHEGISAEDWVVVEGAQKLKTGMSVKPERTTLPAVEAR